MSHAPEIKTEAFSLYLLGNSPLEISKELKRRHADAAADMPSPKTIEKWAYIPDADGKTWSDKRYDAEASARDVVTKDFVSTKSKILQRTLKLQELMQQRVERGFDNAEDVDPENLEQAVYALVNVTKSVDKMLDKSLAEEARRKDAVDCLVEAMRRTVPGFEELQPKIMAEFNRLVAEKTTAT
jgi:hypothetical protein